MYEVILHIFGIRVETR